MNRFGFLSPAYVSFTPNHAE